MARRVLLSTTTVANGSVYTTRDSATGEVAVCGLNFSSDADARARIDLSGFKAQGVTEGIAVCCTRLCVNGTPRTA